MFVNTQLFRTEALSFLKNGYYCPYPRGTAGYKDYWDEQTKRCIEGYEVGGVKVTGLHYAYLNFAQIERVPEGSKKGRGKARKVVSFPDFWDGDFEYFWEVEFAKQNQQHLIVAKSRRKGFSFKNAFMCAHQYNFERNSRAIISGFIMDYSTNTMNMTLEYLNFFNEHTAWRKNRLPDTRDYVRAAFEEVEDGVKVIKGYKSEIQAISFKDNPFKSIGKGVGLFLIDEAGKFPNLKATWSFTRPTLESGDFTTGLGIIFGTGGDMEAGSVDFAEMFYSPETYGFRAYDNRWDEDALDTKCGFFFPDYQNREGHIDEHGNSLKEQAIASEIIKRETIKKDAKSRHTLTQYLSQQPFTPREAFLRSSGNIFPVAELAEWLSRLEFDEAAHKLKPYEIGELVLGENNKPRWARNTNKPILNFPLKANDDPEGAIVIWEHPEDTNGLGVPGGLYIAGCDPIDHDEAESSDSLGSIFIYKKFYKAGETYHRIVAEYTGRPSLFNGGTDKFYEIVRRLCMYYNARCLYENQLKGLKTYMQKKNSLHYLAETPTILTDRKIIKNTLVNRGYGIHMSEQIKRQGELYIADWLVQPVTDMDGKDIMRLHTIRSIPLLKELISYNREHGNFDRVMAFMCVIFQNEEEHNIKPAPIENSIYKDPFWGRTLFTRTVKNASYTKKAPL